MKEKLRVALFLYRFVSQSRRLDRLETYQVYLQAKSMQSHLSCVSSA